MKIIIASTLLLFSFPAYAKVLPGVWDGTCIFVTDKYQHRNFTPHVTLEGFTIDYSKGFIPPALKGDDNDIKTCYPYTVKNWDRT